MKTLGHRPCLANRQCDRVRQLLLFHIRQLLLQFLQWRVSRARDAAQLGAPPNERRIERLGVAPIVFVIDARLVAVVRIKTERSVVHERVHQRLLQQSNGRHALLHLMREAISDN